MLKRFLKHTLEADTEILFKDFVRQVENLENVTELKVHWSALHTALCSSQVTKHNSYSDNPSKSNDLLYHINYYNFIINELNCNNN